MTHTGFLGCTHSGTSGANQDLKAGRFIPCLSHSWGVDLKRGGASIILPLEAPEFVQGAERAFPGTSCRMLRLTCHQFCGMMCEYKARIAQEGMLGSGERP